MSQNVLLGGGVELLVKRVGKRKIVKRSCEIGLVWERR